MADIGVLPTRTTIRITSSTGECGTVPAATPTAAGVMTAEQAGQLSQLWAWMHAGDSSGQVVIMPPPVAPRAAAVDSVSRIEMQAALERWRDAVLEQVSQTLAQLQAGAVGAAVPVSGDGERVRQAEQALLVLADRIDRLDPLPARVTRLEGTVGELNAAFEAAAAELGRAA